MFVTNQLPLAIGKQDDVFLYIAYVLSTINIETIVCPSFG